MEQRGQELDDWEELVQKAVDAEAKASLLPSYLLRDMDQRVPCGKRPAEQHQGQPPGSPYERP